MKRVLILLAIGFEETEAVTLIDVLRRGDVEVTVAGLESEMVEGAHAIKIMADTTLSQVGDVDFDAVILPGGMGGTKKLMESPVVTEILQRHAGKLKIVGAICAAPWVLDNAKIIGTKRVTIFPGLEDKLLTVGEKCDEQVVVDGNIITSKGPATAMPFALTLLERLIGKEKAEEVAHGLLFFQDID
jgi:protein deglycase